MLWLDAVFFFALAGAVFKVFMSLSDRPLVRKTDILPHLVLVLLPVGAGIFFLMLALSPEQ